MIDIFPESLPIFAGLTGDPRGQERPGALPGLVKELADCGLGPALGDREGVVSALAGVTRS